MKSSLRVVAVLLLICGLSRPAGAAAMPASLPPIHTVLTVNNSGDAGDGTCDATCTLRDAILAANAAAGADSIQFEFYGTIVLASTLPAIADTAGLTITGSTGGVIISGAMNYRPLIVNSGASLSLQNLTIAYGHYDNTGGAVLNSGTLTVNHCVFEYNNAVNGSGGAIYNATGGNINIDNSTFLANHAANGGAIVNNGSSTNTITINRSLFKDNTATVYEDSYGGAIENQSGITQLTNTTFTGNTAPDGSAVVNPSGWVVQMENVTIAGNYATAVGGASLTNASGNGFQLTNTIVANPAAGVNCKGEIWNNGNNLDSGTSCGWGSTNGSMSNTNPFLTALGNYGGPTQTFALNRTSPAIDGVTYSPLTCTTTDQRGFARPYDGNHDGAARCDIGAYETGMQTFLPLVIR